MNSKIEIKSSKTTTRVYLDGNEIHWVRSLSFWANPREVPTVELELIGYVEINSEYGVIVHSDKEGGI